MKHQWWLVILLLLSLGLNLGFLVSRALHQRSGAKGVPASASDPAADLARHDDRLPRFVRRMADDLGLEGEQRDAFVEIQRTFFEQTIAARRRMATLQGEIRREVTSADPDRAALEKLLTELSTAHGDLERAFVNDLLDSRELLDDGQAQRYMRFLRRMRNARADVEKRFRERWRRQGPQWPGDPRPLGRRDAGRFGDRRSGPPPPGEEAPVPPPVERPPVERPPVERPPVERPPVERPPVERPPVERPSSERPDSEDRPGTR